MRKNIKILFLDIDGTLTDGIYSVSSNGIITKNFYTRDFCAIERLLKNRIKVFFITSSEDKCIAEKCKTNNFLRKYENQLFIFNKVGIKEEYINYLRGKLAPNNIRNNVGDFHWHEIAYMGDAQNDLASMKLSAISACPCDAEKPIIKIADYVSPYKGGHGAVADFIEHLLENDK